MRDLKDDLTETAATPAARNPGPPPAARAWAARLAGAAAGPDASELRARYTPLPAASSAPAPASGRSPEEEERVIFDLIEEMRPSFRRDGGDIELLRVEGSRVIVRLSGACAGCMLADQTLGGVQKRLADILGRPFRVIPDIRH